MIYAHQGCADGTAAVFVVQQLHPTFKVFYVKAGGLTLDLFQKNETLDQTEKTVKHAIFLDLTVPVEVVKYLEDSDYKFGIIDHHINDKSVIENKKADPLIIDSSRSACVLAWQHYHKDKPVPNILKIIEQRDLWKQTKETDEILCALHAEEFLSNLGRYIDGMDEEKLLQKGRIIMEQRLNTCRNMIRFGHSMNFKFEDKVYKLLLVTGDTSVKSDVGNLACEKKSSPSSDQVNSSSNVNQYDICVYYQYNVATNEFWLSWRSREVDINQICRTYDPPGGGHKFATGLTFYPGKTKRKDGAICNTLIELFE